MVFLVSDFAENSRPKSTQIGENNIQHSGAAHDLAAKASGNLSAGEAGRARAPVVPHDKVA